MNEKIKMLIELAANFEEADNVLGKYANKHTTAEKLVYIEEMFDFSIVGQRGGNVETDYISMLSAIVSMKWRGNKSLKL